MHESGLISLFKVGVSIHNLNRISEKELGISLVQWCLLKKLIDMPATSALALAGAAGVHPSTLTQTLKRLEKKKLVFVSEDPGDSRKKLITLTKEGRKTLAEADVKISGWNLSLGNIRESLGQVESHLTGFGL